MKSRIVLTHTHAHRFSSLLHFSCLLLSYTHIHTQTERNIHTVYTYTQLSIYPSIYRIYTHRHVCISLSLSLFIHIYTVHITQHTHTNRCIDSTFIPNYQIKPAACLFKGILATCKQWWQCLINWLPIFNKNISFRCVYVGNIKRHVCLEWLVLFCFTIILNICFLMGSNMHYYVCGRGSQPITVKIPLTPPSSAPVTLYDVKAIRLRTVK